MEFFTDGSCLGNPGNGGWAFVFKGEDGKYRGRKGNDKKTTNNRMELMAMINVLNFIWDKGYRDAKIYTDSQYVKNCLEKWIKNWKKNDWVLDGGGAVKNVDLLSELDDIYTECKKKLNVTICWVKGHGTNEGNNYADKLARNAALSCG